MLLHQPVENDKTRGVFHMASQQMTAPMLEALIGHPQGMTAKDVGIALGWSNVKASRYLGIMFFAGDLDRRSKPSRTNNEFVYTVNATAKPKPSVSEPVWVASPKLDAPTERLPKWAREIASIADRLADGEVV